MKNSKYVSKKKFVLIVNLISDKTETNKKFI